MSTQPTLDLFAPDVHPVSDGFDPLLIAGRAPETFRSSTAAAVSVLSTKDSQRQAVYAAIAAAGSQGRTDDELQVLLGLDGSSERPRRWELWKRDQIQAKRTTEGATIYRLTRTHRRAVVWVVNERNR